ncbi:MAG: hypothetical protein WBV55_21660 [Candidatus Sulfotelmatobacter sp.]
MNAISRWRVRFVQQRVIFTHARSVSSRYEVGSRHNLICGGSAFVTIDE